MTDREALKDIASHFLPGDERRIYGDPTHTLDRIRTTAREALAGPPDQHSPQWDEAVDAVMERFGVPEDYAQRVVETVTERLR